MSNSSLLSEEDEEELSLSLSISSRRLIIREGSSVTTDSWITKVSLICDYSEFRIVSREIGENGIFLFESKFVFIIL